MVKGFNKQNHEKMIVWQMADRLDVLVQNILHRIPRHEFKIIGQIDSASDSIGSNFIEGYYSNSTKEYIRFCRYARRSCGELQERVRRLLRKGYINMKEHEEFSSVAIRTGYLFDRLLLSLEERDIGAKGAIGKKE